MAEFLVEMYVSRGDLGAVRRRSERARLAAEDLQREGTSVRYLRSIHVPEDETCFFLYEAASAAAVLEVLLRSELPSARVAEVASWQEPATPEQREEMT